MESDARSLGKVQAHGRPEVTKMLTAEVRRNGAPRRARRVSAVGLVSCGLAGVLAFVGQPSTATSPGLNGSFVVDIGRQAGLLISRPNDTEARQLTSGPALDGCPAVSPSGLLVGFCRANDTGYDLWLVNVDGSNARQVTTFPANTATFDPTFSSSRPRVAFSFVRDWSAVGAVPGLTYDIHSIGSDGTEPRRLTRSGAWHDSSPAFSPDGHSLLWTRTGATRHNDGRTQLWMMRANGKDKRQVRADINRGESADWSPDGRLVVYRSADALKIVRPDGTLVRVIADRGKDPVWSPNGRWIAYRTVTHIEMVSRDGSSTRSVPRFWGQGHLRDFAWQPLPQ